MGSTIAGQYGSSSEAMVRNTSAINQLKSFDSIETQEEELLELIKDAQENKEIYSQSIKRLASTEEKRLENWQSIATDRKNLQLYEEKMDKLAVELKALRSRKDTALEEGVHEERMDFYSFIAGLTGKEVGIIEFIISALPAVFLDVIAALALNLALYIKDGK
jgi:chromosome segregation ATPase